MMNKSIYFLALRPNLPEEATLYSCVNSWLPSCSVKKSKPFFVQVSDLFECTEDEVFDLGKEINKFTRQLPIFPMEFKNILIHALNEDLNLELTENSIVIKMNLLISTIIKENPHISRTPQFSFSPQFHMNVLSKNETDSSFSSVCNELSENFKPISYTQDTISLMEFNGKSWSEKFFFQLNTEKSQSQSSHSAAPAQ
jgi:hypothetical protein